MLAADPATEAAARRWLEDPAALFGSEQVEQICSGGPAFGALVAAEELAVTTLFTAGNRAAFHAACRGTYAGGFDDIDAALAGSPVTLLVAGMMTMDDAGAVSHIQLSADRLGLHRALLNAAGD